MMHGQKNIKLIYCCSVWWQLPTICSPCIFKNNGMSCI